MKLEKSEILFVSDLFNNSIKNRKVTQDEVVAVTKLTGDASTRRYYRLKTKLTSYVVCLDSPYLEEDENRYPFYLAYKMLKALGIRVPDLIDMDLKRGYLLEEDLGNRTLLHKMAEVEDLHEEYNLYKRAIDILLTIQNRSVDVINYKKYDLITNQSFDNKKLMFEFNFTLEYFLKRHLKGKLYSKEKNMFEKEFFKISQELTSVPMCITHRDFHSRNIMYTENKEMALIDFQDARMGIPQYDLVSLLEDCYYSISLKNIDNLVNYYHSNLKFKDDQSKDKFIRLYDLMTFQRVFKAIGSFSYIFCYRRDKRYLKYIGYGMEKIRHILMKYPEYSTLRLLLSKHYYES